MAFAKKDLLTVWVLNSQRSSAVSAVLNLEAFELKDGPVVVTSWEHQNRREGEQATVSSGSIRNAKLTVTVPARSLHCYEIHLKRALASRRPGSRRRSAASGLAS